MRTMRRTGARVAALVLLLALVALLLPQSTSGERLQLTRGGRSVTHAPLNAENDDGVDVALHATEAPLRNSAMAKVSKLRLRARAATEEQSALASGAASLLHAANFMLPSKVNRRGAGGRAGRAAGNGGQSGRRGGNAAGNGGQSGRRGGDAASNGGQSGRRGGNLPVSPIIGGASLPPGPSNVVALDGMGRKWPVKLYLRNQGDAATCWAHSALSLLELRLQMAQGDTELKNWFSIDQVIKCVKNSGVDGGNPLDAIEFLLGQKLMWDSQVRAGMPILCGMIDWNKQLVRSISPYSYTALIPLVPCVNPGENCARMADYEWEMERQFATTPMLAYVDASQWHTYKPVFHISEYMFTKNRISDYTPLVFPTSKCSMDPMKGDHLVILLGTVTCPKTKRKFWRVYNSWGKEWGVNGYIFLEFEKNACGLANYPVGLADYTPQSDRFDTNRAMLMIPKTVPRAIAMSFTLLKNPAGLVGGKETYDAAMAAAKKKK